MAEHFREMEVVIIVISSSDEDEGPTQRTNSKGPKDQVDWKLPTRTLPARACKKVPKKKKKTKLELVESHTPRQVDNMDTSSGQLEPWSSDEEAPIPAPIAVPLSADLLARITMVPFT